MRFLRVSFLLFFFNVAAFLSVPQISCAYQKPHHHDLTVTLDTDKNSAKIQDSLLLHTREEKKNFLRLYLHANFWMGKTVIPDHPRFGIATRRALNGSEDVPLTQIEIRKPDDQPWPDALKIELEYEGAFFDPQNPENKNPLDEGILLSGASYFYPQMHLENGMPPDLVTFQLTVSSPADWKVVSQGRKLAEVEEDNRVVWETTHPMEEIFLIANRFEEYQDLHRDTLIYAFLLSKDSDLARKYIEATKRYLDFYERLIGPYPYPKFALVENSEQTGYGMASFTFLGSKVIRFPFILNTSYPHEILHNWWGNSVYIDPASGNWAEGLTAYLADHLLADLEGKGKEYRLQQLMKFMNYVNKANDFPLIDFKFRTSMASQAIGYGKMLMMLHMLRLQVGDEMFLKAVREFYKRHQFQFSGLNELKIAFESVSNRDLSAFFDHWTRRIGGPELELTLAQSIPAADQFELQIELKQKQSGPAFPIKVPFAVWTKGSSLPKIQTLDMVSKTLKFSIYLPEEPGKVMVDPYTEIFRKLDRREIPPSIGQIYGATAPTKILPTREDYPDVLLGYHQIAQSVEKENTVQGYQMDDADLGPVPKGSLWVFGRHNEYAKRLMPQLKSYGVTLDEDGVVIDGNRFSWEDHSFTFTLQRLGNGEGSVTWVIVNSGESVPGLIRKLPHYGKYGSLIFKGKEPENVSKRIWPFEPSSLTKIFQAGEYRLPSQPPLVDYKPN